MKVSGNYIPNHAVVDEVNKFISKKAPRSSCRISETFGSWKFTSNSMAGDNSFNYWRKIIKDNFSINITLY